MIYSSLISETQHGQGMVCAAENFPCWKEDPGSNFGTDQRWICSEVKTKPISSCLKLMIRWPANTWGNLNAPPPAYRQSLNRLLKNWRENGTVQDRRKRRPSSREGIEHVTNQAMVDEVAAQLDAESVRKADEPGSSSRRNPFNISPSSFFKIAKKKLHS